jgi:hypothetical protein
VLRACQAGDGGQHPVGFADRLLIRGAGTSARKKPTDVGTSVYLTHIAFKTSVVKWSFHRSFCRSVHVQFSHIYSLYNRCLDSS